MTGLILKLTHVRSVRLLPGSRYSAFPSQNVYYTCIIGLVHILAFMTTVHNIVSHDSRSVGLPPGSRCSALSNHMTAAASVPHLYISTPSSWHTAGSSGHVSYACRTTAATGTAGANTYGAVVRGVVRRVVTAQRAGLLILVAASQHYSVRQAMSCTKRCERCADAKRQVNNVPCTPR